MTLLLKAGWGGPDIGESGYAGEGSHIQSPRQHAGKAQNATILQLIPPSRAGFIGRVGRVHTYLSI